MTLDGHVTQQKGLLEANGTTNGKGGTVEVLGDLVSLHDGSVTSASGDAGGGTVLVGGDYQGKGETPTAERTFVAKDAKINVDAGTHGDGGKAIVWSDKQTHFYGDISAKGGSQSGNGGFTEVSGKENLDFRGKVNLMSYHGNMGSLLLDPLNIIIETGGGADYTDVNFFANAPGTTQVIDPINFPVSGTVTMEATNNITVNDSFTVNSGSVLFLVAGNDITVNSGVTINAYNIAIAAGRNVEVAGDLNADYISLHADSATNSSSPDGIGELIVSGNLMASDNLSLAAGSDFDSDQFQVTGILRRTMFILTRPKRVKA